MRLSYAQRRNNGRQHSDQHHRAINALFTEEERVILHDLEHGKQGRPRKSDKK